MPLLFDIHVHPFLYMYYVHTLAILPLAVCTCSYPVLTAPIHVQFPFSPHCQCSSLVALTLYKFICYEFRSNGGVVWGTSEAEEFRFMPSL